MIKRLTLPYLLLLLGFSTFAQQSLASKGPVFKDDVVPSVYITIDPDSLESLMDWDNRFSNHHYPANFVFDNGTIRDSIANVGFRLRGNTSRSSIKKSFKISFNEFEGGRNYQGLEKINLNGEHNDPSIIRSKLCFDFLDYLEVPASRTSHAKLYINGIYFGLYLNVEHIDEEFTKSRYGSEGNLYKCTYGANLYYRGSSSSNYQEEYYEIKRPESPTAYEDLAHFIDVLNNTESSNFECELEKVFNVNTYIKVLVMDVLVGNWDGPNYNKNNFYLYYNQANRQFEYIPYDLDNSFGVDFLGKDWAERNIYSWSKNGSHRPLYQKVLDRQKYKDYFSYWMGKSIDDFFNSDSLNLKMNSLRSLIRPAAILDTIRSKDYGYTISDFDNSFGFYYNEHVKYGLRDYVSKRTSSALTQLNPIADVKPLVYWNSSSIDYLNDSVKIELKTLAESGVESVIIEYGWDAQSAIWFDTLAQTNGNGVYQTTIKWHPVLNTMNYILLIKDSLGEFTQWPSCSNFEIIKSRTDIPLYLNELMASNTTGITDEEGKTEDWIEVFNGGDDFMNLKGFYITDDLDEPFKYGFQSSTFSPKSFKFLWADSDEEDGDNHLNFKLSAKGETIAIFNEYGSLIDSISYSNAENDISFGREEDGKEPWVFFQNATPNSSNHLQTNFVMGEWDNEIGVYPNPSVGVFKIISNSERVVYSVSDSKGSQVVNWTTGTEIDLSTNSKGIYFVKIRIGEELYSKKLVLVN
ncbi:MAG: hypothetical protein COA58_15510 [Bacteroidetes bacterium]|nr:MAG: hypothetical protein COA58_15510 [Bacteroidota bacterium]